MNAKAHFRQLAAYNRWANDRLYGDAAALPHGALNRNLGLYFKSLFATLVHLIQTDRVWRCILQDGDRSRIEPVGGLHTLVELRHAREAEDQKIIDWIESLPDEAFEQPFVFTAYGGSFVGRTYTGTRQSTLTHLFNHQTHHRGQAHTALSLLGVAEPTPLDILVKGFLAE